MRLIFVAFDQNVCSWDDKLNPLGFHRIKQNRRFKLEFLFLEFHLRNIRLLHRMNRVLSRHNLAHNFINFIINPLLDLSLFLKSHFCLRVGKVRIVLGFFFVFKVFLFWEFLKAKIDTKSPFHILDRNKKMLNCNHLGS